MKRFVTKTILLAAAGLLATQAAQAADLRASGTISGATVTVGDIFDDAGEYAGRYLAPAPARGQSLSLNAYDLRRISDAFDLDWQPASQKDHIVLRREFNEIDRHDIEAALKEDLAHQMKGQKFDIEFTDPAIALSVPPHTAKTVDVTSLRVDLQKNTFTASIAAPAGADKPAARKSLTGRLFPLVSVPVLAAPARAGDVISATDIEYVDMRADDISVSTVVDAAKLIGQTPRRGIGALRPVADADIMPPLLVKKGEIVTVALQNGSLGLTMQGRALQNGAEGDVVRIVNVNSNRTIEGIVTGAQTVALRLPSSTL